MTTMIDKNYNNSLLICKYCGSKNIKIFMSVAKQMPLSIRKLFYFFYNSNNWNYFCDDCIKNYDFLFMF